jgi:hypothetical protein
MMSDPRCYAPVKQASYVAGHNETSNMPLPCRAASGITSRDKILNREVLSITHCRLRGIVPGFVTVGVTQ